MEVTSSHTGAGPWSGDLLYTRGSVASGRPGQPAVKSSRTRDLACVRAHRFRNMFIAGQNCAENMPRKTLGWWIKPHMGTRYEPQLCHLSLIV